MTFCSPPVLTVATSGRPSPSRSESASGGPAVGYAAPGKEAAPDSDESRAPAETTSASNTAIRPLRQQRKAAPRTFCCPAFLRKHPMRELDGHRTEVLVMYSV